MGGKLGSWVKLEYSPHFRYCFATDPSLDH